MYINRKTKECYQQLYPHQFDNLRIEQFLERFSYQNSHKEK